MSLKSSSCGKCIPQRSSSSAVIACKRGHPSHSLRQSDTKPFCKAWPHSHRFSTSGVWAWTGGGQHFSFGFYFDFLLSFFLLFPLSFLFLIHRSNKNALRTQEFVIMQVCQLIPDSLVCSFSPALCFLWCQICILQDLFWGIQSTPGNLFLTGASSQ